MEIDAEGRDAAIEECLNLQADQPTDGLYCNATWDGWGCWNYTLAGVEARISCPWYIEGFDPNRLASKECTETGDWRYYDEVNKTWSNYTQCVNLGDVQRDKQVIYVFVAGYSLSIISLLISLCIFTRFKQLQCDRITLHKNLFISYILNGIAWIPYYIQAAMKPDILQQNPVWCQVLHVVTQYLVTCNFFWMFCEGLYLHTIIVVAFLSSHKLVIACHIIGWGLPLITTTIYTIARGLDPDASLGCWLTGSNLGWIIFGPIIITLLASVVFLCDIIRVLVTKLRAVNSPDTNQTRKAVRATVILIPLLGLQFILFPFAPNEDDVVLYNVFRLGSAFVTSFQGFFVSLIFCFLNGEVITIVKRKWKQHRLMRGSINSQSPYQTTYSMDGNTGNHVKKCGNLLDDEK